MDNGKECGKRSPKGSCLRKTQARWVFTQMKKNFMVSPSEREGK